MMTDEQTIELMARKINPSAWAVLDGYLNDILKKHKGENIGYDPAQFKHQPSIKIATEQFTALKSAGFQHVPKGSVVVPREVIDFIMGEGPLDGFHFGERPASLPPYWWRSRIRAMIEAAKGGE